MHLRLTNSFSSAKSSPPHNVDSNETLTLNVDNFIGGILLYFWLLHEGEQWIRAIMERSLKVTIISLCSIFEFCSIMVDNVITLENMRQKCFLDVLSRPTSIILDQFSL